MIMRQITLNIPDNKYKFFMELVQNLGFDKAEELHIHEEHKAIVRERIKNTKQEELISWEEARKQLHFKDKL